MTEWTSIARVPEIWRAQFLVLVQNEIVLTRAAVLLEYRPDPAEIAKLQAERLLTFASSGPNGHARSDALAERFNQIPIVPFERLSVDVAAVLWQHVEYGHLSWETASFFHGIGPGEMSTTLTGISYDTEAARRLGLIPMPLAEAPLSDSIGATRGRPRKAEWDDWAAALALEAADGKISGSMTEAALNKTVADRMASWSLDEIARGTTQRVATAILRRFRAEGI